jgi:hypothetical protein
MRPAFRLRKQVATALAKEELKKTLKGDTHSRSIDLELGDQPQEPTPVRYRTNDTSYEALAELIASNPTRCSSSGMNWFRYCGILIATTQPRDASHRGSLHFRPRELAARAHCGIRQTRQQQRQWR